MTHSGRGHFLFLFRRKFLSGGSSNSGEPPELAPQHTHQSFGEKMAVGLQESKFLLHKERTWSCTAQVKEWPVLHILATKRNCPAFEKHVVDSIQTALPPAQMLDLTIVRRILHFYTDKISLDWSVRNLQPRNGHVSERPVLSAPLVRIQVSVVPPKQTPLLCLSPSCFRCLKGTCGAW